MSSNPKNYFGFIFDEFTKLDCRAFSLFEAGTGSLISQILSDVMLYTSSVNLSYIKKKIIIYNKKIIFRIA